MNYSRADAKALRAHPHEGHLGGGAHAVQARPVDRRGRLPRQPPSLGRRSRHRRRVRLRQAGRVLRDVGRGAQAHLRDRGRRDQGARRDDHVLLGPEPRRRDRACPARAGDRRRLHRGARAGPALPAPPGRHAGKLLPHHQRAGGDRHRAVEPSRQRLPDEPRAVRPHRRAAERGGHQVQRPARDVCAAHPPRRRQDPGEHGIGRGVVRQHRRARLAALSLLLAALPVPDQGRPADARLHRPCVRRRRRAGARDPRQPQSGAPGVPRAAVRRKRCMRIRNTGRSCSARPAAPCAPRCWS